MAGEAQEGVIYSITFFQHERLNFGTTKPRYVEMRVSPCDTPKYRKKALYGTVRKRAGEIIRELAKRKGVEVIEGNACPDHIHMVISIPPRISVAGVVGFIKGKSAIRLHYEFGKKRGNLQQKSFWSRGYFISTVGIDREQIIKYVQDQWKKDKFIDGPQLDLHWN